MVNNGIISHLNVSCFSDYYCFLFVATIWLSNVELDILYQCLWLWIPDSSKYSRSLSKPPFFKILVSSHDKKYIWNFILILHRRILGVKFAFSASHSFLPSNAFFLRQEVSFLSLIFYTSYTYILYIHTYMYIYFYLSTSSILITCSYITCIKHLFIFPCCQPSHSSFSHCSHFSLPHPPLLCFSSYNSILAQIL